MQAGGRFPIVFLLPLLMAGCRSHANQELLESELRARDFQVRDMKDELARSHHLNQALTCEIGALRQHQKITPEQAAQTFGLKRIVLGRLTGGVARDGQPGDHALEVHVEPRDSDDHAIKTPGTLYVQALEIRPDGTKAPIGVWEIKPEDLRKSWKPGLLSSAYVVTLPWQNHPATESLRVVARLHLSDGRMYEADRDIRVRLAPGRRPHRIDEIELPPPLKGSPKNSAIKPTEVNSLASPWRPASHSVPR